MRLILRLLGIAVGLCFATIAGAYIYLQDANRLKPDLEALIADNSDFDVALNGDLHWQLLPPLTLRLQDVHAQGNGMAITAGSVDLHMDFSAMWEDINHWHITALRLTDVTIMDGGSSTRLNTFTLSNFAPGTPADFNIDAIYTRRDPEAKPVPATIRGKLTYTPAGAGTPQRVQLTKAQFTSEVATGECELDLSENLHRPSITRPPDRDDILPVATLLAYNAIADCTLAEIRLGTEVFRDAAAKLTHARGKLNLLLAIEDFLGGTMLTDVDIDVSQQPVAWQLIPEAANVDSQRLMDWRGQNLQWAAPLALSGTVTLWGNTEAALMRSILAEFEFDGGQGRINIARIKQQLRKAATLAQRNDKVDRWPDVWDYEAFTGRWNLDGGQQDLEFALDHMSVEADGSVDYANQALNILAHVTMHEAPDDSPFTVNPLLAGTPVPIRCRGPARDPDCKLDDEAAQRVLAKALRSDDDSGLRKKLEQKIEKDVPEEYRDTARSLLDLLGKALDQGDEGE